METKKYLLRYSFGLIIETVLFFILWNTAGGDIIFIGAIWIFSLFFFIKTLYQRNNIFMKLIFVLFFLVFGYALIFLGNFILESRFIEEPVIIGYVF